MKDLIKKTAILAQLLLVLSLPFIARAATAGERSELKLTPYAISLIQGKLCESTESNSPMANRDTLRTELEQYCLDHHLPFNVTDSIR